MADNFKFLPDINSNVKIEATTAMHEVRYFLSKKIIARIQNILKDAKI